MFVEVSFHMCVVEGCLLRCDKISVCSRDVCSAIIRYVRRMGIFSGDKFDCGEGMVVEIYKGDIRITKDGC